MIRWLKKKEGDAEMQRSTSCRIDSAQDQLTAYQAWLNIVYLAIKDVLHLFITPKTSFTKRSLVSGRSRGVGGGSAPLHPPPRCAPVTRITCHLFSTSNESENNLA